MHKGFRQGLKLNLVYTPIAFDERVILGFTRPCHCLCVRVCCIVCHVQLSNPSCIRQPMHKSNTHPAQTHPHTPPHTPTVTHIHPSDRMRWSQKSYSLVESNQTMVDFTFVRNGQLHILPKVTRKFLGFKCNFRHGLSLSCIPNQD